MADIAGLKLIVPTSVSGSGVSVSASGKVTFTSATNISVNDCFSSTYDNYLIVLRGTTTSGSGYDYRLRSSGTDNSTASSYVYQRFEASGTIEQAGRATSNQGRLASDLVSTTSYGFHAYIYSPFLAQPTVIRTLTATNANGAMYEDFANTHNQSTSYDGLTLIAAASSTGALTIYGLSQ